MDDMTEAEYLENGADYTMTPGNQTTKVFIVVHDAANINQKAVFTKINAYPAEYVAVVKRVTTRKDKP